MQSEIKIPLCVPEIRPGHEIHTEILLSPIVTLTFDLLIWFLIMTHPLYIRNISAKKNQNPIVHSRDMARTRNPYWNSSKSNCDLDLWPIVLVLNHDTPSLYKEYFYQEKLKSHCPFKRYGPDTKSGRTDGGTDGLTDRQMDSRHEQTYSPTRTGLWPVGD